MEDLQVLRKSINEIDVQILKLLNERVVVCRKIGDYKKQQGLPVRDLSREQEVYEKVRALALEFGLEPARIELVYREIVNMCSDIQK